MPRKTGVVAHAPHTRPAIRARKRQPTRKRHQVATSIDWKAFINVMLVAGGFVGAGVRPVLAEPGGGGGDAALRPLVSVGSPASAWRLHDYRARMVAGGGNAYGRSP